VGIDGVTTDWVEKGVGNEEEFYYLILVLAILWYSHEELFKQKCL
jgi:hypothetical protein